MILPSVTSDADKAEALRNAGWKYAKTLGLWHAPGCTAGLQLQRAWQAFLLGKRCEQPLVKTSKE